MYKSDLFSQNLSLRIIASVLMLFFLVGTAFSAFPRIPVAKGRSGNSISAPKGPVATSKNHNKAKRLRQTRDEIHGISWKGEMGVQRVNNEIMQTQLFTPDSPRPLKPRRKNPALEERPQNTNAIPESKLPSSAVTFENNAPSTRLLAAQTVGLNFDTVTGPNETGAFPPDSMGVAGPSQFVLFVNGRIRTFSKATGVADGVMNVNPDTFFASVETPVAKPIVNNFTTDPQVRYDRLSGRWFLSIVDVPCTNVKCTTTAANRWMVAVSDAASSGAITGSTVWTFFFFQPDAANFCDYPSLGVDVNALYIGCNMFAGNSFAGTNGYVVQKASIFGAGPIFVTSFANLATASGEGPFSPRGVDNYDPTSNEGYFIGSSTLVFSRLDLRRVNNPGSASPTISANILLTVPTTFSNTPVDHLGNTGGLNGRLDSIDDRLFAAHIRNGRLWTAHNIGVDSTGTAGGTLSTMSVTGTKRMAVRWYELNGIRSTDNGGTPVVVQSGIIFDNAAPDVSTARQFWIPTAMVSGQGHAALGFSTAGTPFHADAATTGRLAGDPLGTMQAVNIYSSSSTAYNPPGDTGSTSGRRWGDYSFTSLDPLDDMTMWTIQEYCNGINTYGARVVQLKAPPPATPSSTDKPTGVPVGQSSINVVVTGTSAAGSGFYDPGPNLSPPALPFTHLTASITGGVTVNSVTYNSPTQVTLNISTVGATPGLQNITITNPDGQAATGNGLLNVQLTTAALADVKGRVINARGHGVRGIAINLSSADGLVNLTAVTNGSGNYIFQHLTIGKPYFVVPASRKYAFSPSEVTFDLLGDYDVTDILATAR